MSLCAVFLLLVLLNTTSQAEEIGAFTDLNFSHPGSLQEATRVLEEEVKLAARPQAYLLIDLVAGTIHIKARGIDLHRIPIDAWSFKAQEAIKGTHRLIARPPILRRKIDPTASIEQEPISLADMPINYTLAFAPTLTIEVVPSGDNNPFHWIESRRKTWWREILRWTASLSTDQPSLPSPYLRLEINAEQAQSLAWSVVNDMPLVVRRPADSK